MSERPDDLLAPDVSETEPSTADLEDEPREDRDDWPALSAEESLGLLPPD